jgi:DNA (cytosine-5)-methyltransferase 1
VLHQGGYEVLHPISTLNAADFGVPQRRKRAFVLGYRSGNTPPTYPKPQPRLRAVTVNAAIGDLLLVEKRPLVEGDCYDGPLGRPSAYARRLRARSPHAARRANLEGGLSGFARTAHSRETVQRFRDVEVGAAEEVSRFIRLDPDGLARFMAPRPIHHKFHRVICTREAARLHSYPDWFAFHETKWHSFMQIGNSVPPTLARVVAAEILRAIRSD